MESTARPWHRSRSRGVVWVDCAGRAAIYPRPHPYHRSDIDALDICREVTNDFFNTRRKHRRCGELIQLLAAASRQPQLRLIRETRGGDRQAGRFSTTSCAISDVDSLPSLPDLPEPADENEVNHRLIVGNLYVDDTLVESRNPLVHNPDCIKYPCE